MRKITKKTIKRIKEGYHDDLMDSIEFLIDTYNENKFDLGYESCMSDMSVRSYRLAEHIEKNCKFLSKEELAKIIEAYFINALKE